ncbi:MAG: hypothetical protein Q9183_003473 [Haloplaca sp. 2 TL-2023]
MAQWIQFAVSIDSVTILSKTSNEVIELLSHQLQALELIHELKEDTGTTKRVVVDIKDSLAASSVLERRRNVLDWLSNISQEEVHNSVRSLHTPGTCRWLLQHPVFQQWKHRPLEQQSVLWCHGPPGSGKTVLVSEVIENLRQDEGVGVAYIYFDYRVHMHFSLEEMTAMLLRQLANARPELPRVLDDFYDKFKAESSTTQWQPLLKTFSLTSKGFAKTFVVVDALDECDPYTVNAFLKLVGTLQTCSRVLVASRSHQGSIRNAFQATPQIQIIAQSSDMRSYILDTLTSNNGFGSFGAAFEDEIADKITQSSHHMFLLATLHLENVLAAPTVGAMKDALDGLPETLAGAFSETMLRIESQTEDSDVAKIDQYGSALHHAAGAGHVPVIRELIESDLDPNVQDDDGRTPIFYAARSEHCEAIRELINGGAKVDHVCPDVVRLLLQSHADPNLPVFIGMPLLIEVTSHQSGDEILHLLLQYGADVNMPSQDGLTALQMAASKNKLHFMRLLLESGARVDAEARGGYTALHAAARRGFPDVVKLLLQYGAALELPGTKFKTPLHLAAKYNHVDVVHILLEAGADLKACMKGDGTPLDIFLKNDAKATYDLLMESGAKQESAASSAEPSSTATVSVENTTPGS